MVLGKLFPFIFFLFLNSGNFSVVEQAEEFYRRGLDRMENKEYLKAIGDFTHAISLKPDYADAYYQRAMAKFHFGKEKDFFNAELCYDLMAAIKFGNEEAIATLNEIGKKECQSIKTAFTDPDMTFCLDVNSSQLRLAPSGLPSLQVLSQLNLWNNKLETFDLDPEDHPYLVHLNLGSNELASLGNGVVNLPFLYELNLSKNKLEELPANLAKLQKLAFLNLRNNNLTLLPASMGELKSLHTLDISLNFLETLPKEIGALTQLKYLILTGNPINAQEMARIKKALPNTEITF